jgi:hypothetical protein
VDSVTVERPAWVDSWLWLYRGVADSTTARTGQGAIAADDDGNSSSNNYWASRLSGTLAADTYTIRATSYDYVVAGQRAVGTYTLSSGLIPHRDTATAVVDTATVIIDTPTVTVDTPTVPTSIPEPTSPVQPPLPETGPILIMPPFDLPQEIVVVEETIAEVIPTVDEPLEELPVVEIPPDIPEEIIEDVAQLPEDVAQLPLTIEEAIIDIIAEAEANGEVVTTEALEEAGLTLADLSPETPVQLDNGVVLEAGTVVALQLLESPAELIAAIFSSPAEAFTAISNIGADMSDEERTTSEQTIIASVIAGQAAINAVGAATATRTPPPTVRTPSPTGGGGPNVPTNENIKLLKRRKP